MAYITTQDLQVVQDQVTDLSEQLSLVLQNEGNYITGRELAFGLEELGKTIENAVLLVNREIPKLPKIQQALNALAIKFRAYATNETAIAEAAAVLPTAAQKEGLDNVVGTPSITNPFILNDDPRLTDERNPLAHSASHEEGGIDELDHDSLLNSGTSTHAELETAIANLLIAISDAATERLALSNADIALDGRLNTLESQTLDDLPEGLTYVKTTIDEKARIVSAAVFDALANSSNPSSFNRVLTKDDADTIYQVIGTYVTLSYLSSIEVDLLPSDNTKSLGSATNPWKDLFITNNSLHIGDVTLSIIDGQVAVDGVKVVNLDNITDLVSTNADVVAAKAHSDLVHDWEMVRTNTGTLPTAAELNTIVSHRTSNDHDYKYVTRTELNPANVALTADLTSGTIPVPFSSLTGVPEYGSPVFKGSVSSKANLPTTNLNLGDIWGVRINPNSSQLSALYIVTNYLATTVDAIYKPVFDVTKITHNDLSGRDALDAHSQYMTEAQVGSYILQPNIANSLKSLMGISGTGSLFSTGDQAQLTHAYNHAFIPGNPHATRASDIGALEDIGGEVKIHHLDIGSNINLDNLVIEGIQTNTEHKFITSAQRANITTAINHVNDSSVHITLSQKTDLTDGGDSTSHYHSSDRNLLNSTGNLDARTRLTFLLEAVNALSSIITLQQKSHDEGHTLASHTDTAMTGAGLQVLANHHSIVADAHNRAFSPSGGDNGSSTYVARSNHLHDTRYVKLIDYAKLANSAGDSSTKVHWNNLTGVPATVGDTRVIATAGALASTVPLKVGEQVVVTNYDGSGNWGVYIATGSAAGEFSLITTENAGLLYAASNHNHDTAYMPLSGATTTTLINNYITSYLSAGGADKNIPTDSRQALWTTATDVTLPNHINDTNIHVTASNLTALSNATTHIATPHLSAGEVTALTTGLTNTVYNLSSTINANTRTLTGHLTEALNALSSLTLIPDWPSGRTITDFENLFTHNHDSVYSQLGHTHLASDITNLETSITSMGFWKEADANTWLTTKTTDDIAQGLSNRYLNLSNLRDISAFTNLEDHADDAVANKKHLSDGEKNALTSGASVVTDLHSHAGMHYTQDNQITIGLTRTSIASPVILGKAGLVKANQVVISQAPPANGSSSGEEGEIRCGGGKLYSYQSGIWYVSDMTILA